jgi:parallel beta-helix repeat protein
MMTMQQQQTKTVKPLLAAASLLLGLALASPAVAVQCGDTIGPNQTITLQTDLICDDNTGGLTVIGPAEVNLNDHTIQCQDTNQNGVVPLGLHLLGKAAKVYGYGIVKDCVFGVSVEGEGRHTVDHLTVRNSRLFNFYVASDKNDILQSDAENGGYGFVIGDHSHKNFLYENFSSYHDNEGFVIDGNNHQLYRNSAGDNGGDGFSLYGQRHTLTENVAFRNQSDGFDLQEGAAKKITLRKNLAKRNGQDGFQISGEQHKLTENDANENANDGIQVHEASHIKLTGNKALNNNQGAYPGIFDLKDLTPDCGTNTWKQNIFNTASQPCIQ